MNERLFLKLLLLLFSGLIAAELLIVSVFGLRLELILLFFIIAVALTGIAIVTRLLRRERPDIESVSMRRERQKSSGIMQERLRDYGVDHEFISGKSARPAKESGSASSQSAPLSNPDMSIPPVSVSLDEVIKVYAEMYGGFGVLLRTLDQLDDAGFGRLMAKAGLGTLSREEVIHKISQMAQEEPLTGNTADRRAGESDTPLSVTSLDKESFDEYIRRSMNNAEGDADSGFSVELDSEALSRGTGTMPSDFSHDPKAVFSKLKKPGTQS
jgi:hypothetical protein